MQRRYLGWRSKVFHSAHFGLLNIFHSYGCHSRTKTGLHAGTLEMSGLFKTRRVCKAEQIGGEFSSSVQLDARSCYSSTPAYTAGFASASCIYHAGSTKDNGPRLTNIWDNERGPLSYSWPQKKRARFFHSQPRSCSVKQPSLVKPVFPSSWRLTDHVTDAFSKIR